MHATAGSRVAALAGLEIPGWLAGLKIAGWLAYRPRGQAIATAIAKTGRPGAGARRRRPGVSKEMRPRLLALAVEPASTDLPGQCFHRSAAAHHLLEPAAKTPNRLDPTVAVQFQPLEDRCKFGRNRPSTRRANLTSRPIHAAKDTPRRSWAESLDSEARAARSARERGDGRCSRRASVVRLEIGLLNRRRTWSDLLARTLLNRQLAQPGIGTLRFASAEFICRNHELVERASSGSSPGVDWLIAGACDRMRSKTDVCCDCSGVSATPARIGLRST